MTQIQKVLLADALVDGPFSGAPTTVVYLGEPLERFKMASLAAEFGTLETVYVYPHARSFLLRFFTPLTELKVSINSSHAAAFVVYELGLRPPSEPLSLLTQDGEITARYESQGGISMEMDADSHVPLDAARLDACAALIGIPAGQTVWGLRTSGNLAVLAVEDREILKRLNPDIPELLKFDLNGIAATALSRQPGDCDYFLRSFRPRQGQTEEHVSGSINRSLAPRWASILRKATLSARQLSRRGGLVTAEVGDGGRITLKGRARIILRSDICLESLTGASPF
ncbi:MAG: PhzF family phenazine biosynthesis protein [Deltaproteobacteria bacterium]|jgi:PhzF family phenazine biosynthesis protein|nr:PhzF family phenazine biosynthesis protein [Deltaproteobacteria bacterium]